MKTSICFYGQPRTYKKLLPQWNKIISELSPDIFIHTWRGENDYGGEINVNELVNDFRPKEIEISQPHNFIELIPNDSRFANTSRHAMNQAYSISKSVGLLNSYSRNFKKEYDITIRCRPDIILMDVNLFIEFIKHEFQKDKLYVAANQWVGTVRDGLHLFDDNILVGESKLIKSASIDYFSNTIDFITQRKIIPCGERNLYEEILRGGMLDKITRASGLNFQILRQ
jgi:hypothetical protein